MQAEGDGILPGRHWVEIFKRLDTGETVSADPNGALWAELPGPEGAARVGLSASDILAPDSDPRLAYQLMLARNDRVLKSPRHSRETMAEFKQDWARLQSARAEQRGDSLAAGGGRGDGGLPQAGPRSGYATDLDLPAGSPVDGLKSRVKSRFPRCNFTRPHPVFLLYSASVTRSAGTFVRLLCFLLCFLLFMARPVRRRPRSPCPPSS